MIKTMKRFLSVLPLAAMLGTMLTACYDEQPPVEYTISVTAGEGGAARAGLTRAIAGEIVPLTATPTDGYAFRRWTTDETVFTLPDTVVRKTVSAFYMPAANAAIGAEFGLLYAIRVSTDEGGTAVAAAEQAMEGEEVALTATPERGYAFIQWVVGEGLPPVVDTLTKASAVLTMPAADVSIRAEFEALTEEE